MARIYLFSKTPHSDVEFIPILETHFFYPNIDFQRYDAIVITSKVAIEALENISTIWREKPILSIASSTHRLAEHYGAKLLARGDGYGDSLYDIIVNRYSHLKWLYPRPKRVASDFFTRVIAAGVTMEDVEVYETTCNKNYSHLEIKSEDVIIFTSPFSIECFSQYYTFAPQQKVVAIGKTTAKALPLHVVPVVSDTPSVEACVALAKGMINNEA